MGRRPTHGDENRRHCHPRVKLALSLPKGGGPGQSTSELDSSRHGGTGMTGIGRLSSDQEMALLLNPLSSGSADCQWSEGSPALRHMPPFGYKQPSINHLFFNYIPALSG